MWSSLTIIHSKHQRHRMFILKLFPIWLSYSDKYWAHNLFVPRECYWTFWNSPTVGNLFWINGSRVESIPLTWLLCSTNQILSLPVFVREPNLLLRVIGCVRLQKLTAGHMTRISQLLCINLGHQHGRDIFLLEFSSTSTIRTKVILN